MASTSPPRPRPLPEGLKGVVRAIGSRRFEDARTLARKFLEAHPRDGQATFMIGLSYAKSDNHGAARPYFEEAHSLDPDYYIVHWYLGESRFLLGDLPGARSAYEAFRAVVPNDPKVHLRLGTVDVEESRLDEAEAHFQRSLELFEELRLRDPRTYQGESPELAGLHARMGDLHFARDDYAAARTELLEATRIWPHNISAFFTLSLVHRRLGEDDLADQAAAHYEAAQQAILERQKSPGR